ncbi:3956_t:CDS:1 [Funneliformis caledonium]|uniref:3956_t:CDS:1 n=1 Tax=Funneliformis caledonium TaxID=1117310 RepID=A0A9N8Z4Z9_9GLOM|nr:3956_t:CDS:1 [Funneliformis caledonium]
MVNGLEVRYEEKHGYGLFATRDFEKGEIILSETPLINTLSSKRDRTFACTFDVDLNVFSIFKTFFDASPEVQNVILNKFYLPPQDQFDSAWSSIGSANIDKIIKTCINRVEAWSDIPEDTFRKVFMIFTLNSQDFSSDGSDGSAIFVLGSKMNHSCEANTFYQSIDGQGIHTAVERISKGEQITTDYLGKDSILSKSVRHMILKRTKLFACECPRCTEGMDVSRGLPCPNCSGCIQNPRRMSGGYIYWYPMLSTTKTSTAQSYWLCDMCNSRFEDNSPRLHNLFTREADLVQRVIALEEKLNNNPFISRSQLTDLYNTCLTQLGTRHWTYVIILKIIILFDASNGKLQSKNTIIEHLDQVLTWYERIDFDVPRYLGVFVLRVASVLIQAGEYAIGLFFLERVFDDFEYGDTFVQDYKFALDLMAKCRTAIAHTTYIKDNVVTNQINCVV